MYKRAQKHSHEGDTQKQSFRTRAGGLRRGCQPATAKTGGGETTGCMTWHGREGLDAQRGKPRGRPHEPDAGGLSQVNHAQLCRLYNMKGSELS